MAAVAGGATVAVVSDAGTPGISDPGARLAARLAAPGETVSTVPGPSAVLGALVVSGLPTERFCVEGFLPRKGAERRRRLAALGATSGRPVVLEAPGRVAATLGRPGRRRRRPAGRRGAGADQAARGGLAGHAGRGGGGVRGAGRAGRGRARGRRAPRRRSRPATPRSRRRCGPRWATTRRRARARSRSAWPASLGVPRRRPTRPRCASRGADGAGAGTSGRG